MSTAPFEAHDAYYTLSGTRYEARDDNRTTPITPCQTHDGI